MEEKLSADPAGRLDLPLPLPLPLPWRLARGRFGASLVLLLLFLLFCGLYQLAYPAYLAALHGLDGVVNGRPFGDLGAILQAGVCWRHGVDVYVNSACMGGGVYNYAPLLLWAAYLPIGVRDTAAGGILLAAAFMLCLAALPAPASAREFFLRAAAAASPTTLWLLEAANFDIVIFLLTCFGVYLVLANRFAGYVVFLFAAALKFYPVALLLLAARERPARCLAVGAVAAVSLVVYIAIFADGTATAIGELPGAIPFHDAFGAKNIPFGLVLLHYLPVLSADPAYAQYHPALTTHGAVAGVIFRGTRLLSVAALLAAAAAARRYKEALPALDDGRRTLFLGGAGIIVFCFFGAQNLQYRAVFLLLTLPGIWRLAERRPLLRKRLNWLLAGIVLLLWEAFFRVLVGRVSAALLPAGAAVYPQLAFWLARDLAWWWVVVELSALLLGFLHCRLHEVISGVAAVKQIDEAA